MTVTVLTGRALNNQPFLVTSGQSSGGTDVAPSGTLTAQNPTMTSGGAMVTFAPLTIGTNLTYHLKYKKRVDSSFVEFGTVPTTPGVYAGLQGSTLYDFQIVASNTTGSVISNTVSGTTSNPSSAPGTMTDIVFTQPYPLHPESHGDNFGHSVGWFDPVGGIGPYTWQIVSQTQNNMYTIYPAIAFYNLPVDSRPQLGIYYSAVGTGNDTVSIKCTDGRGTVVGPKTFSITKSDGTAPVFSMPYRNPNHNGSHDVSRWGPFFSPQAAGGNWNGPRNFTAIKDTSTGQPSVQWQIDSGQIAPKTTSVPAGSYPVTVSMSTNQGDTHDFSYTINIIDVTPISYIEFFPGVVSTGTPPGWVIGKAAATTPWNFPTWTITDATNTFTIVPGTGEVSILNTPANTNPITFVISVSDKYSEPFGSQVYTKEFTITPGPGAVLPASAITWTPSTTLNNHTVAQTIGTASVTGISGTKQWKLLDWTDRNDSVGYAVYGAQLLFDIDSNGVVTQANLAGLNYSVCAAQTYDITIHVTDGQDSCALTTQFVVHPAAVTTTYHIGEGMSTAHPGFGFEHYWQFLHTGIGQDLHNDKVVVKFYANSDPEYFTNDFEPKPTDPEYIDPALGFGSYNYSYQQFRGPMRFEGVSLVDGTQARLGGPSNGMQPGPQLTRYGGSPFRLGDGDWEIINIEFSGYHVFPGGTGVPALFRNGSYGNCLIQNCRFRDNDLALDSVTSQCNLTFDHCEFEQTNSGVYLSSGGLAHGIYDGGSSTFNFTNNLAVTACGGNMFKCRARKSTWTGNRIIEGLYGGCANCIEIDDAGDAYLANNVIQKGMHPTNEAMIRFGSNGSTHRVNQLIAENNVFLLMTQLGGERFGVPVVMEQSNAVSPFDGSPLNTIFRNNQVWMNAGCQTSTPNVHESGTTMLTIPPAIDLTRPFLQGTFPVPHRFYLHSQIDAYTYPNYENVCQIADRVEIRVPHTASTGTVLCNITASTDAYDALLGTAQQFNNTTTWAIDPLNTMADAFANPNPWAPSSRYTVTKNSDGSATLKVGTGMPSGQQVDYVQVTATCGSVKSTQRYAITVT